MVELADRMFCICSEPAGARGRGRLRRGRPESRGRWRSTREDGIVNVQPKPISKTISRNSSRGLPEKTHSVQQKKDRIHAFLFSSQIYLLPPQHSLASVCSTQSLPRLYERREASRRGRDSCALVGGQIKNLALRTCDNNDIILYNFHSTII